MRDRSVKEASMVAAEENKARTRHFDEELDKATPSGGGDRGTHLSSAPGEMSADAAHPTPPGQASGQSQDSGPMTAGRAIQ